MEMLFSEFPLYNVFLSKKTKNYLIYTIFDAKFTLSLNNFEKMDDVSIYNFSKKIDLPVMFCNI